MKLIQRLSIHHKTMIIMCFISIIIIAISNYLHFEGNRFKIISITICITIFIFLAVAFVLQKLMSTSFMRLTGTLSASNITALQLENELIHNGQLSNEFSMMLDAIKNRELERDNAITALRESEKRFKTIVANIPGIVYRFSYDKELTTMYISFGVERLTGYPPSDFIGNKFRRFTDIIHSKDRDWFFSVIKQAIAQRKSYALEYRIMTSEEDFIWVRDEGQTLFDRDTDELLYVDGVILDITERKLLEIELQNHKERLEDLVKERTKELDKARIAALNLAQDANIEKLRTEDALATVKKRETELHKAETELKIALQSAQAASLAKSDFISQVSHELRTPLNAIIGYCQILKTYDNITEEQLRYIATIRASGDILLSLINDILDYGKIEAREMEIVQKEFDLKMLIVQLFDIHKIKAEEKDLLLVYEESSAIPQFVRGDERKLRQILSNLLSNAIKYTNSGNVKFKISFENTDNKDLFKFIIEDTGIGIADEHLQTIFEPFKQVGEQSKFVQGTGLGLAITQKFINLLQGKLTVSSEPGKGSHFCAELELKVLDKNDIVNLKTEISITGYQGERKKILLVDDNITNISILHEFLKNLGFLMQTAKNGEEAVLYTMEFHPDLILIDLIMPAMDGLEAIKIIRGTAQIATIKIIGLTASIVESEQKNNFIALCDDFLNKPVDFSRLLIEIQTLLRLEWLSLKLDYTENIPDKSLHYTEIPNKKNLHELLNLLEVGNFHKIEALTNNLVKEDELLVKFCKIVQKYCQAFDDEKLTRFIQQFI